MNKIKPLEIIKEKFKNDAFARNFGIVLDSLTEDSVKMHMKINESVLNFYNRPHGGAIYTLADVAFSLIGNNQNNVSVALSCTIIYHSSPNLGEILHVEGKRINQTNKIGTYYFKLFTEENGNIKNIATMMGTLYRTGKSIIE
ncbi:MAG: PaaI family thioesterase [Promethearchaeota archaeon]